jgi:hypothetical protein
MKLKKTEDWGIVKPLLIILLVTLVLLIPLVLILIVALVILLFPYIYMSSAWIIIFFGFLFDALIESVLNLLP